MTSFSQKKDNIAVKIALFGIKIWQKTISLDHGPFSFLYPYGFCRYRPTCSEYSRQAIERFGAIKGIKMSISRIIRCNPFKSGGEDPVR